MESRIIKLSEDIIAKIAAGEVIERPASCIKELIENAIDAGAHTISCEVKGNGVPELKVIDDGYGMSQDEIEIAVQPHTTSKLKTEKDLFNIKNFGFRGEALASICKVAEVEITSRVASEPNGNYIKVRDDQILEKKPASRNTGTTIRIKDLFYSMPARRKFLKSAPVELKHIINVIQNMALVYPDIAFTLTHDDKEIMKFPKSDLKHRILAMLGNDFLASLAPIEHKVSDFVFSGYLSKPFSFAEHPKQFIFINNRTCRDRIVRRAIENAYAVPMKEKIPSFVVFLKVPPEFIDVNVHPRKEEVRFKDESFIYNLIINGIRIGLGIKGFTGQEQYQVLEEAFDPKECEVWQLHNSYIFAQTPSGLLIVDQHAAHERIMFERVMREKGTSQKLLFPVVAELTDIEEKFLLEYKDCLIKLGFEIEEFGKATYRITAIPSVLKECTAPEFKSLLSELQENEAISEDKFTNAAKRVACRASVMAGAIMKTREMQSLLDQLFHTNNPYFCPHGRPTIIKLTREELERKFGR
ncbi:MAG: DNA mismatch repair endonuclease MutL [bacterium]